MEGEKERHVDVQRLIWNAYIGTQCVSVDEGIENIIILKDGKLSYKKIDLEEIYNDVVGRKH